MNRYDPLDEPQWSPIITYDVLHLGCGHIEQDTGEENYAGVPVPDREWTFYSQGVHFCNPCMDRGYNKTGMPRCSRCGRILCGACGLCHDFGRKDGEPHCNPVDDKPDAIAVPPSEPCQSWWENYQTAQAYSHLPR